MSTSNIHQRQQEHEQERRRVLRQMEAGSAEHQRLGRHRDQPGRRATGSSSSTATLWGSDARGRLKPALSQPPALADE